MKSECLLMPFETLVFVFNWTSFLNCCEGRTMLVFAGVLGPHAILPSDSRIPLTMGEYVNLSLLGHT